MYNDKHWAKIHCKSKRHIREGCIILPVLEAAISLGKSSKKNFTSREMVGEKNYEAKLLQHE